MSCYVNGCHYRTHKQAKEGKCPRCSKDISPTYGKKVKKTV